MKSLVSFASAVALAAMISAPLATAAPTPGETFIRKAIQGNLAEIKQGKLAEQKGATPGVRRFGEILQHDHAVANQKAMVVASAMGVAPPSMPSSKQQKAAAKLESLSGKRFDKTFVKMELKDHKKAIAKYRKAEKAPTGPAATYAQATLPVLHKHLRIAERLAKKRNRG